MDAWRPKHVEDYDAINCLRKWKWIKLVTLLWHIFQIATSSCSCQQSEVATAVVFNYWTSTRHSSLLGATANPKHLPLTNLLTLVVFLFWRSKRWSRRPIAVSYGGTILNGKKSLACCPKTTKGSLHQVCQTEGPPRDIWDTFVLSWGPHTTCGPRAACLTCLTYSMFSLFRMFLHLEIVYHISKCKKHSE
jgi:hypothetical protein